MANSEKAVIGIITSLMFPNGFCCIYCGKKKIYELCNQQYKCKSCQKRFRLLTGTKLENMKIPLSKFIEIISCFIDNVQPEKIQKNTGLRRATVYTYLKIIRLAVIDSLPEEEKAAILEDKAKVFRIAETGNGVNCEPIFGLSERELQKCLKNKTVPYDDTAEFVTQKRLYRCNKDIALQINKCSHFYQYLQNKHEYTSAKYNTKKFSLYLKAQEYLYNQAKQGKTLTEIVIDIIKLILKPSVHASVQAPREKEP